MKKKEIMIASIIVIGVLCVVATLYYLVIYIPTPSTIPIIELQKTETADGMYLNLTNIEADGETPIINFQLVITDDTEGMLWNLTDIMNTNEGPFFVDNDNDEKLSPGDSFFIPNNYVDTNDRVEIFHIPTDSTVILYY